MDEVEQDVSGFIPVYGIAQVIYFHFCYRSMIFRKSLLFNILPKYLTKLSVCQAFIKQYLGSHQAVVRQLSGSCHTVLRQSSGSHQAVIRQSSGSHPAAVQTVLEFSFHLLYSLLQISKSLFHIFADFWFYGGCVSRNMDRSPFRWFRLAE